MEKCECVKLREVQSFFIALPSPSVSLLVGSS